MWNTQEGLRTLKGAERELFRRLADLLWFDLEMEADDEPEDAIHVGTSVQAFDSLTLNQRFVVLSEVVSGLLLRGVAAPILTQNNEACIAAIYSVGVDDLLDARIYPDYRHLIRAVVRQRDFGSIPGLHASKEDFRQVVYDLVDLILWDADYECGQSFLDQSQEVRDRLYAFAGVHSAYFTTVVPDPQSIEPQRVLLKRLLGGRRRSFKPEVADRQPAKSPREP
jgi:hypothetical protein